MRRFLPLLAVVFLATSFATAAGVARRGEIFLRVVDGHGHPLPGATVTLRGAESRSVMIGRPVITPASGEVRYTALDQGLYLVRIQLSGYITVTLGPLPIELKEPSPRLPRRIDVVLPAGPIWF